MSDTTARPDVEADPESRLTARLKELNEKATQLLLFLSFAIVAIILLRTNRSEFLSGCENAAARWSLRLWVISLFPILFVVLPIQELVARKRARTLKVILLWIALGLIILGATAFLCAVWRA